MTRRYPKALALAAATTAALALTACGSSTSPSGAGSSSPPATPSSGSSSTSARLTVQQVAPLIVQCFADKHLIPAARLAEGKTSHPRSDSSTWLHHGKVSGNLRFGAWYSAFGSAVPVDGKTIDDWVHAVVGSRKAWPADVCGPLSG